jgi:hypothetical protein
MGIATTWSLEREKTGKERCSIITNTSTGFVKAGKRLFGKGALKFVPSNEKLYVMIHGDDTLAPNSFEVSGTRDNGEEKAYDPSHLARHLEKEELTKAITDIHLAICNGGRPDDVGDSFASIFKAWMIHRGYQNLTVYGYTGNVRAGRLELHDGQWIKYSRISHIDPNGIQVDKFYRLSKVRTAF